MFKYLLELSNESGGWVQSPSHLSPIYTFSAVDDESATDIVASLPQVKNRKFSVTSLSRICGGLQVQKVKLPDLLPWAEATMSDEQERMIGLERFSGGLEEMLSKLQPFQPTIDVESASS
ncbi:MAG: hypothetical protein WCW25_00505 [Patescibacteria group bacterium]|jgi:hypothetical protein